MPSPSSSDLSESFVLIGENNEPRSRAHPSQDAVYKAGSSTSYAHDWSLDTTGGLSLQGRHFVDSYGRVCGLRGVNLSGACKTPANDNNSAFPNGHEGVTFVGRPFPLAEAPEHFARLRRWGFSFIRFLVTWEAIEHAGPGLYDEDYLSYLHDILSLLPQYGIVAFVAMHQDVWSRYSGGSGAPAWTLTSVGFDIHELEETNAAWLKGVKGGGHAESERGLWPCGYQKLAAATMSTCFWAGDVFARKLKVKDGKGNEVSIQTLLQNAFLNAWEELVKAVGNLEGVIGFEMINEPHRGYVELQSFDAFDYNTDLHLGHVPSALQSFSLAAGHPTLVPHYTRSFPFPTRLTSHALLNTSKVSVWRPEGPTEGKCLWEMHGVWGWDVNKKEPVVLRMRYFLRDPMTDRKVDWYTDFYFPFLNRWAERVQSVAGKDKIIFTEPIPNEFCPESWTSDRRPANMVFAPHWYDLNALFNKAFGDFSVNVQGLSHGMFLPKALYWGQRGVRDNYALQIRNLVEAGYRSLGETPVIIGECGVPMDMNLGRAFKTDDWKWQCRMMDAMVTALERSLVGYTLWNYNPDNNDSHGDHWNGENFSWFSRNRSRTSIPFSSPSILSITHDQTSTALDQGGRILRSLIRPYPAKTAGIPLKFEFDINTGRFVFEWADPFLDAERSSKGGEQKSASVDSPPLTALPDLHSRETEIFIPAMLTIGRQVLVEGLNTSDVSLHDESRQTLFVLPSNIAPGKIHRIVVSLDPPLNPVFAINDFWTDFGMKICTFLIGLLAVGAYYSI